jgi:hypothetical protein
MTYWESLTATMTTLTFAWIFKKYIEPKLDKGHDVIKKIRRKRK